MAEISVPDFESFINEQVKAQEDIEICLIKLKALLYVAMTCEDFFDFSSRLLSNYIYTACGLVDEAGEANQKSLKGLIMLCSDVGNVANENGDSHQP